MTTIRDELLAGTHVPIVPWSGRLVASLVMGGMKVVPPCTWDDLGRALLAFEGDYRELRQVAAETGWTLYDNHMRTQDHESFQSRLADQLVNDEIATWVIPVEELIVLAADDREYEDFVSIARIVYKGSPDEGSLATRVRRLIAALEEASG